MKDYLDIFHYYGIINHNHLPALEWFQIECALGPSWLLNSILYLCRNNMALHINIFHENIEKHIDDLLLMMHCPNKRKLDDSEQNAKKQHLMEVNFLQEPIIGIKRKYE